MNGNGIAVPFMAAPAGPAPGRGIFSANARHAFIHASNIRWASAGPVPACCSLVEEVSG
jgi:hypothetical protein